MIKGVAFLAAFFIIMFVVCWFALSPVVSNFTMLKGSGIHSLSFAVVFVLPILLVVFLGFGLYISGNRE